MSTFETIFMCTIMLGFMGLTTSEILMCGFLRAKYRDDWLFKLVGYFAMQAFIVFFHSDEEPLFICAICGLIIGLLHFILKGRFYKNE